MNAKNVIKTAAGVGCAIGAVGAFKAIKNTDDPAEKLILGVLGTLGAAVTYHVAKDEIKSVKSGSNLLGS